MKKQRDSVLQFGGDRITIARRMRKAIAEVVDEQFEKAIREEIPITTARFATRMALVHVLSMISVIRITTAKNWKGDCANLLDGLYTCILVEVSEVIDAELARQRTLRSMHQKGSPSLGIGDPPAAVAKRLFLRVIKKVMKNQCKTAFREGLGQSLVDEAATLALVLEVCRNGLLEIADELSWKSEKEYEDAKQRMFSGIHDAVSRIVQTEMDRPMR